MNFDPDFILHANELLAHGTLDRFQEPFGVDLTDLPADPPSGSDDSDDEVVDEGTRSRLKEVLTQLATIEDILKQYNIYMKRLRGIKNKLRSESMQLMMEYDIGDAKVSDSRFMLREVKRKENPLTKKRLPDSLLMYFEQEERMSTEKAKTYVDRILKWVMEHNVKTKTSQSLYYSGQKKKTSME